MKRDYYGGLTSYRDLGMSPEMAVEHLNERVDALERALKALAAEPGQPHHAAAEALKILNRES